MVLIQVIGLYLSDKWTVTMSAVKKKRMSPRVDLRRSPRIELALHRHSRELENPTTSTTSFSEVTPRTLVENFLQAHHTVQVSTRKRARVESPTNENPMSSRKTPRNQSPKTLTRTRASSLRKRATMNNLLSQTDDGPTPRTVIQGFIAQAPVETPVVGTIIYQRPDNPSKSFNLDRTRAHPVDDSHEEDSFLELGSQPTRGKLQLLKNLKVNLGRKTVIDVTKSYAGVHKQLTNDTVRDGHSQRIDEEAPPVLSPQIAQQIPVSGSQSPELGLKRRLGNRSYMDVFVEIAKETSANLIEPCSIDEEKYNPESDLMNTVNYSGLHEQKVGTFSKIEQVGRARHAHRNSEICVDLCENEDNASRSEYNENLQSNAEIDQLQVTQESSQSQVDEQNEQLHEEIEQSQVDDEIEQSQVDDEIEQSHVDEEIEQSQVDDEIEKSQVDEEIEQSQVDDEIEQSQVDDEIEQSQVDEEIEQSQMDEAIEQSQVDDEIEQSQVDEEIEQSQVDEEIEISHVDEENEQSHVDEEIEQSHMDEEIEQSHVDQEIEISQEDEENENLQMDLENEVIQADESNSMMHHESMAQKGSGTKQVGSTSQLRVSEVAGPSVLGQTLFTDDEDEDDQAEDDVDATLRPESQRLRQLRITELLHSPALQISDSELPQVDNSLVHILPQNFSQKVTKPAPKVPPAKQVMKPASKAAKPLVKPRTNGAIPRMPVSLTKSIAVHFSKNKRISKDVMNEIDNVADIYWKNLTSDLTAYSNHAHRHGIEAIDVELLMKRQGFINDKQSLITLVEEYLPMEYRKKIIPIARSHNRIE